MALRHTYEIIRGRLPVQVQGACGLYSFFYAARLLRATNERLPAVPTPRKSEAEKPGYQKAGYDQAESLRKYAKRELRSGQGEILTEDEMVTMVRAWRYDALPSKATTAAEKKTFLVEQTGQGWPVLIAFLACESAGRELVRQEPAGCQFVVRVVVLVRHACQVSARGRPAPAVVRQRAAGACARTDSITPRLTITRPQALSMLGCSPSSGTASTVASTGASAPTIEHFCAPSRRTDRP